MGRERQRQSPKRIVQATIICLLHSSSENPVMPIEVHGTKVKILVESKATLSAVCCTSKENMGTPTSHWGLDLLTLAQFMLRLFRPVC